VFYESRYQTENDRKTEGKLEYKIKALGNLTEVLQCCLLRYFDNDPVMFVDVVSSLKPHIKFVVARSTSGTTIIMAPNKQEPGRYQRWTNRTLAYRLLQQGLQPNGNIDPNMRPKDLWESN
jgi:hypothetical protein